MHEQRGFAGRGGLPEGRQVRIVEDPGGALGLRADHGAVEAGVERLLQDLGSEPARLHRDGRERYQEGQLGGGGQHVGVEEAAPVGRLLGRQVIAEHVEPAADDLLVDAMCREPLAARLGGAHPGRDRSLGLVPREGEPHAAIDRDLHRRRNPPPRCELLEQGRGNEVGMRVDDHRSPPWGGPRSWRVTRGRNEC
jgi:hypothetical protein